MFARTKLLVALLSVVLLSAAVWVGYAVAGAPVDANAPITMTKGMYADLLCIAASEFGTGGSGLRFAYDPGTDTLQATFLPSVPIASEGKFAAANAELRKNAAKERLNLKMKLLLPKFQQYVSTAVSTAFVGF